VCSLDAGHFILINPNKKGTGNEDKAFRYNNFYRCLRRISAGLRIATDRRDGEDRKVAADLRDARLAQRHHDHQG
jgi:hypothetical protein